ncbi:MAG: hypothetical protein B6D41_17880 [Chloroflexi bacterium UTCFX4]|jgi:hypothetical protein|nr:MAG: hypothetical protein B6D41_17880 [Chloroflexi bacterium UTCFX4]
MALKGNLRDFSIHQLLNLINLAHKTGSLQVKPEPLAHSTNGRGALAALFFREGRLIHASFEGKSARLTDVLVQVGRLTTEQAQTVNARSRVDTDKELGLLLIQNGYLSQNDIIQGVRGYLLETVYQLFTWAAGDFHFEPNQLPPEERITVPLSLENVILEGNRRQQEWERLRDEIPDLDAPLRFAERPSANLRDISLTREQWQVISFINSKNTIKQISEYLGWDEFQIRRIVHQLKQNGLIEMAQPTRPEPLTPRGPVPGAKLSRSVLLRIIDGVRRR